MHKESTKEPIYKKPCSWQQIIHTTHRQETLFMTTKNSYFICPYYTFVELPGFVQGYQTYTTKNVTELQHNSMYNLMCSSQSSNKQFMYE